MSHSAHKRDIWHRTLGDPDGPEVITPATWGGFERARVRTAEMFHHGRLVTPTEALAIACRDGHTTETLYSISRQCAAETGGDPAAILSLLEREWPDLA